MSAADSQDSPLLSEGKEQASVGVLGWLGFLIINFAVWGIAATASWITWIYGFAVSLVYTLGLIALALWLERSGGHYRQFVNLLWVLACSFVFILGIYISVNVIGKDGDVFADMSTFDLDDPASLLPEDASEPLRTMVGGTSCNDNFFTFSGSVFFRGSNGTGTDTLWYTDGGATTNKVMPELSDSHCFARFRSGLYFSANSDTGAGLWHITAGSPGSAALVFGKSESNFRIEGLLEDKGLLYFKASYGLECPDACWNYTWATSVFKSDGTSEGTVDLMTDPCASAKPCQSDFRTDGRPLSAVLWGVLFLATVPMVVLASFILLRLRLPGPFLNVFGGVLCAAATLYLIADSDDKDMETENLESFLKWFITIETSVLWAGLVAWSLFFGAVAPWLEELKTWVVAVVGGTFFFIIHADLEVPGTSCSWPWVVYGLLALLQLVISAAVSRTVPAVCGAICIFVLACKFAWDIVDFVNIGGPEFKQVMALALLALQGIGIIVATIAYAGNRDKVDGAVRKALMCGRTLQAQL